MRPEDLPVGKRVIVLGCCGSGKSTFSRRLHARTGLPLIHLDNLWWSSDGTHVTPEAFDRALEAVLGGDSWIIDGDYSRTYGARMRACDTIVFLDYDEAVCMDGIAARVGTARTDIPWTERELDPELVGLVRRYRDEKRPIVRALIEKYPQKRAIVFKSRAEAGAWLERISRED